MKKYILYVIVFLSYFNGNAQSIYITGCSDSSGVIRLRWSPASVSYWEQCNRYGYRISRFTIPENGKPLSSSEKVVLAEQVKPLPEAEWETLCKTDAYAPVLAQALYGTDFEVSMGKPTNLNSIIAISEQREQRYGFALMSADMSYPAAVLAGLGYTDSTAQMGKRYFYRVQSLLPFSTDSNALAPDSAGIILTVGKAPDLPYIQNLTLEKGVNTIHLSWNENPYHTYYVGYWIERSLNGKHFEPLNHAIIANVAFDDTKSMNRIYYVDSISDYRQEYFYRIYGQTLYGLHSAYSNVVSGKSKPDFPWQIAVNACYLDDDNHLLMRWSLDEEANKLLQKVVLKRASKDTGPYSELMTMSPQQRELLYKKPLEGSNYIVLQLVTLSGDSISTLPYLVQGNDTIPPLPPQGLAAEIDSLGVVRLSWQRNQEEDMLAYKIFRAMRVDEAFVPLTDHYVYDTLYMDTLSMKMSNPEARYMVIAYDVRYNPSKESQVITVTKPLKIPPAKPVFLNHEITDDKLTFSWAIGSQQGLKHFLYIKEGDNKSEWLPIMEADKYEYILQPLESNTKYCFLVKLENTTGLTAFSDSLFITTGNIMVDNKMQIQRFYSNYDSEKSAVALYWEDKIEHVAQYQIYKSVNDETPTLWQIVPATQKSVYDYEVSLNTSYQYRIIAVLENGLFSKMKTINVKN